MSQPSYTVWNWKLLWLNLKWISMLQYNAIPEKHFLNQHWISFVVSEECEHGEVGVSQTCFKETL